jgi:dolichol-phosphate mannosyltransferase
MIKLAADSVTNFTAAPLRVATWLGLLSFFFCMLMFVYVAISYALDDTVRGWPSVIATVLFLGGAQLLSLGLLGEYLGRLYAAVQGRPTYFVGYDSAESSPLDKVTPTPEPASQPAGGPPRSAP